MQHYDAALVRDLYARAWRNPAEFETLTTYLRPFVEAGQVEATIELARVRKVCGDANRSAGLIENVEDRVSGLDLDSKVDLFMALRSGLGAGGQDERDARALKYLVDLGEAGNLAAQEILMMDYRYGFNGLETSTTF